MATETQLEPAGGPPTGQAGDGTCAVLTALRRAFATAGYRGHLQAGEPSGDGTRAGADAVVTIATLQALARAGRVAFIPFHGWHLTRTERLAALADPGVHAQMDRWPDTGAQRAAVAGDLRTLQSPADRGHTVALVWALSDLSVTAAEELVRQCPDPIVAHQVLAQMVTPVSPCALRAVLCDMFAAAS